MKTLWEGMKKAAQWASYRNENSAQIFPARMYTGIYAFFALKLVFVDVEIETKSLFLVLLGLEMQSLVPQCI